MARIAWTGGSDWSESAPACAADGTPRSVMRYGRSWEGVTAEVVELVGPGRHVEDLLSQKPRLVVTLEEIGGYLETRLAPGQPSRSGCHLPNHLAYVPAGTRAWEFAERFRYIRRIAIDFEPAALSCAGAHWSRYQPRLMFSNMHVWTLADLLADECALPQTDNPSYGKSLALVIFHSLSRDCESEGGARRSRGLTPRQLRCVTDYMKHSSMMIQLQDLADMTGLSQAYFSRAFKVSTGMAPRRWHLTERVRRAQQIMLETGASLAEVALASGFADQSHFTRVFRDITGESPGAWRRVRITLNSA